MWGGGSIDSRPREDQQSTPQRQSTVLILGGIDDQRREDQQSTFTFTWKGDHLCWSWGGADQWSMQRGSTVNVERVNSQLSFSHEKVITCVYPGGVDWQLMWRGSTVNFHFCMKRQLPLLILWGGNWWLMWRGSAVNVERINSQLALPQEKVTASFDGGGGGKDASLRQFRA